MSLSDKEKKAVQWLFPFMSEKPVIFDVGSNKGTWTDLFLEEYDQNCEIHLFEPNKIMLDFTRIKYDYKENIWYNELAVSGTSDNFLSFYFFENKNNGLSSVLYNEKWKDLPMKEKTVETIAVDDYLLRRFLRKEQFIDFIKIDIEGAEVMALTGCERLLSEKSIGIIQVEYSPHWQLIADNRFKHIITYVERFGYSAYEFNGENFVKLDAETFVDDYRFDNFYITKYVIENTQDWNREFIKNTQNLPQSELAIEIGCFEGLTSRYICEKLLKENGRLICIDPLQDVYLTQFVDDDAKEMNQSLPYFRNQYQRFLRNTRGLPVTLIRKTSEQAFDEIKHYGAGFIFVDGDHREHAVMKDAEMAYYLGREDGTAMILFDDYTWSEGTRRAIDWFLETYKEKVEVLIKDQQVLVRKLPVV